MSLDWNATKVADIDNLSDDERVTLNALIWSTISVGIGEITEDNAKEYFARLSLYEKVVGPNRTQDGEPLYFTFDEVQRFVGLHTNVFPKVTKTKFLSNIYAMHTEYGAGRVK